MTDDMLDLENPPPFTDLRDAYRDLKDANARLREAKEALAELLENIVGAFDGGALEMNSPDIGGHDDIPTHPWHEAWMYRARAALSKARGEDAV